MKLWNIAKRQVYNSNNAIIIEYWLLRNESIWKWVENQIESRKDEKQIRIDQNDQDCSNYKLQNREICEIIYFKTTNHFRFEYTRQCIEIMQSLLKNWWVFNLS